MRGGSQGSGWWIPDPRTAWQWQLTDLPVDPAYDVALYDIDLFDNDAAVVADLHRRGRRVVAYVSAGSWEDWRPDAVRFPEAVRGAPLADWPGERWLDVRQLDVLGPLMEARLDLAVQKGFDGVEWDNVDGYANATGFPLTYEDQLAYNIFLSEAAHARGLSVALKNDLEQVPDLVAYFDWALNEECFSYDECAALQPFLDAGKAVMVVEYELETSDFCAQANALGVNAMRKRWDLDAWQEPCW
jgi:hypothetical protein